MCGYWTYLNKVGLLSDEKYRRLTRTTHFSDEEKFEFINRQLVETRQSTKVIASLLKELYPDTEIVYVKAGLVSDFRQKFDLLKSRAVNDLHHAKDAYLNIVVGNVWHHKFSKRYYLKGGENNVKPEIVFTRALKCGEHVIWNGASDKDRVVKIARRNTAHMTKYAFCRKGGFFDQMPIAAAEGLIPRKKDMPTEIYGGYNKSTASFFVLVKYTVAKKQDVMVMPVELLYAKAFLNDEAFAISYAKKTVSDIVNKPVTAIEFLLNKRIIKINTVLSLDGFRVCITGKSGGGRQLGVSVMTAFKTSYEIEAYIKKLESFENKRKKNANIVWSEIHDGSSADQNIALYDYYIGKLQSSLYQYRPANPVDTLIKCRAKFETLTPDKQSTVLLQIQGLFGRAIKADLTAIDGVASAGVATLSSSISNWKKNYSDVRLIDQSASGLFEKISDCNLLDLS
jgi:CRISPR-associated endonuclease Csn1